MGLWICLSRPIGRLLSPLVFGADTLFGNILPVMVDMWIYADAPRRWPKAHRHRIYGQPHVVRMKFLSRRGRWVVGTGHRNSVKHESSPGLAILESNLCPTVPWSLPGLVCFIRSRLHLISTYFFLVASLATEG